MKSVFGRVSLNPASEEIRLLSIDLGKADNPLACTLQTASLVNNKPPYTTISYVWGDPKDVVPILVNGGQRYITRSLANILHQLRSSPGGVTSDDRRLLVWADGLCINQDDDEEKSHQVALMGRIYSECARTLVFLGYPAESAVLPPGLMVDSTPPQ